MKITNEPDFMLNKFAIAVYSYHDNNKSLGFSPPLFFVFNRISEA